MMDTREIGTRVSGVATLPNMHQFQAKHRRADGTPTVMVYSPATYSLDEAAVALAIVFPDMPRRFGRQTARLGLTQAAEKGITGREKGQAAATAVEMYRGKLIELQVFPEPVTSTGS